MELPTDLVNIITDYYVSMLMHDIKQKLNTEFRKNNVVCHLKTFHRCTLVHDKFCYRFCLAVLNYMKKLNMLIL